MFQRIARRHADRPDASAPTEPAPGGAPDAATPTDAAPSAPAQAGDAGQATVEVPVVDAPTERIEAVAPAPSIDQPTAFQPVTPAEQPEVPPSVPPPALDLTTRLPIAPAASAPAQQATSEQPTASEQVARRPGFRARGRMRRRLRYLRKLRELQVRDLGGLVFDLRRFERKRDDLIAQKIDQIRACDDELHALERVLDERRDLRDVREPGIGGTCPRCFAIYGSADKFCANCGAALGGAVQGPARPAQVPPASTAEASRPGSEA